MIAREVESGNDCLRVGRGHTMADEFDELQAEEGEMKGFVEVEDLKESCQQLERRKDATCTSCADNKVILRTEVLRISSSKPKG